MCDGARQCRNEFPGCNLPENADGSYREHLQVPHKDVFGLSLIIKIWVFWNGRRHTNCNFYGILGCHTPLQTDGIVSSMLRCLKQVLFSIDCNSVANIGHASPVFIPHPTCIYDFDSGRHKDQLALQKPAFCNIWRVGYKELNHWLSWQPVNLIDSIFNPPTYQFTRHKKFALSTVNCTICSELNFATFSFDDAWEHIPSVLLHCFPIQCQSFRPQCSYYILPFCLIFS